MAKAKLSEFLKVVKGIKPFADEKISPKLDSLRLLGKVILSFSVGKNKDRIEDGLKALANVESVDRKGDEYHVAIKSEGILLNEISSAVGKVIKDIAWLGGPKPAAKEGATAPTAPDSGIRESPGSSSGG